MEVESSCSFDPIDFIRSESETSESDIFLIDDSILVGSPLDNSTSCESVDCSFIDEIASDAEEVVQIDQKKKSVGREPFEKKFPEVLNMITRILLSNGAAAQERRRDDSITSFGTHLGSLVEHLLREVPGLRLKYPNLSKKSIAYLMLPPRKGTIAAKRYKGLIKARPFRIENDKRLINDNSHRCFAGVNLNEELFVLFGGDLLDCDNMNKVKMNGTTAVSRYHQPRSFFVDGDVPQLEDHDFPQGADYSATISGYVRLLHSDLARQYVDKVATLVSSGIPLTSDRLDEILGRSVAIDGVFYDKQKRLHIELPRSGHLFLFIRANLFHTASVETHLNDIISLYEGNVPAALGIRADRGPDWGPQHFLNVVSFGRLFLEYNMDVLSIFYLAAYNSAFGVIERFWSSVANWLAGITYSPKLQGEELPPCKQSELSPKELREKEIKLFDLRLSQLKHDLSGHSIEDFDVSVNTIPCSGPSTSPWHRFSDHDEWQQFLNDKRKLYGKDRKLKVQEYSEKLKTVILIIDHLYRYEDQLLFIRCFGDSQADCSHCSSLPPVRATNICNFFRVNGIIKPLIPTKDPEYPSHYLSFIQEYNHRHSERESSTIAVSVCEHPLSISGEKLSYCDEHAFLFTSTAERERHFELCHNGLPTSSFEAGRFVCSYTTNGQSCNIGFDSYYKLQKHRHALGHTRLLMKINSSPSTSTYELSIYYYILGNDLIHSFLPHSIYH